MTHIMRYDSVKKSEKIWQVEKQMSLFQNASIYATFKICV